MAAWKPFARLRQVHTRAWVRPRPAAWLAFAVGCLLLFVVLLLDEDGFIPVLDHANLAFHEAGHFFLRPFGRTLHVLGGSLGQLVFPLVVVVLFWIRREPIGVATGWIWFSENLRYIAAYMADARARMLPIPKGTHHDWTTLFTWWGVLEHDTSIAAVVHFLAWAGMTTACLWAAWKYVRSLHQAEADTT